MWLLIFYFLVQGAIYTSALDINFDDVTKRTSDAYEAAADLMRSCMEFRLGGIINPPEDLLSTIFSSSEPVPVVQIQTKVVTKLPYCTIIVVTSLEDVTRSLSMLKSSRVLNTRYRYIFLDGLTALVGKNNSRDKFNAEMVLKEAWKFEILNGIFITMDPEDNLTIYTGNPYVEEAPDPWKIIKNIPARQNSSSFNLVDLLFILDNDSKKPATLEQSFYVFRRSFIANSTYDNIFYDKTVNLNGAVISTNVKVFPPNVFIPINGTLELHKNIDEISDTYTVKVSPSEWSKYFSGYDMDVWGNVFSILNATIDVKIHSPSDDLGEVVGKKVTGLLRKTAKGIIDVGLNSRYWLAKGSTSFTWPWRQADIHVMTVHRGYVPKFRRVLAFFSPAIVASIIGTSLIVLLVLKYLGEQTTGSALLNALRALLGAGILQIPRSTPARIVLGCLMPYYLIIVTGFSTNIAHILIVPRTKKNVDSLADLQDMQVKVFAGFGYYEYVRTYYKVHDLEHSHSDHCDLALWKNPFAACVDDAAFLKFQTARNRSFHLMPQPLDRIYQVYPIRRNWPLIRRVNIIMSKFSESGLMIFWYRRAVNKFERKISDTLAARISKKIGSFNIRKIHVFFLIFLAGLGVATIVFFLELFISHHRLICRATDSLS